jgi:hypothetical protein
MNFKMRHIFHRQNAMVSLKMKKQIGNYRVSPCIRFHVAS